MIRYLMLAAGLFVGAAGLRGEESAADHVKDAAHDVKQAATQAVEDVKPIAHKVAAEAKAVIHAVAEKVSNATAGPTVVTTAPATQPGVVVVTTAPATQP